MYTCRIAFTYFSKERLKDPRCEGNIREINLDYLSNGCVAISARLFHVLLALVRNCREYAWNCRSRGTSHFESLYRRISNYCVKLQSGRA